jgi:hypothetical protein
MACGELLSRETYRAQPPLTFNRPPWESYIRTTVGYAGFTVEPGIEYRSADDFDYVVQELGHVVRDWCRETRGPIINAESIGKGLAHRWPDRAYFVEVWQTGRNGWAQVFQPYGVPRNR